MSKSNMNNHKTYLKCMGMDYDDDDTTNIKYIKQSEKAILPGRVGKLPEDLSTLLNWSTSCNINKKIIN